MQRWLGHHSLAFTLSVEVQLLDGDLGKAVIPPAVPKRTSYVRERELHEAHRLFTEIGATAHAERLADELVVPAS